MLALRLTRGARPAVQLRRLLVTAASAGTGFLLLCALGYALAHPGSPADATARLVWCLPPVAATVHLAVAVARTDPGTRPRPGLAAVGLGPARLMLVSATTTALSCVLGSMLALLVFLHLRGDLTGMPFDGAATEALAAGTPLPVPGSLTLLALVPVLASAAVAFVLRPTVLGPAPDGGGRRSYGRFGATGRVAARETFGSYGRFGTRTGGAGRGAGREEPEPADGTVAVETPPAESVPALPAPHPAPKGLPWGVAVLAAGLAVETYAAGATDDGGPALPAALPAGPTGVLVGWLLTAVGLALLAPGLTHLCGLLLQAVRPGALRLLAGRGLMEEATRIGRPLGVVCAVASAAVAMTPLPDSDSFGPLTALGAAVVTGCAVATLCTAAVEARQDRSGTTAALLRLGAPAGTLRGAAALRAGALLAVFGPLTLVVAELAALPLSH
ncbi:hypothetical protein ACFXGG_26310 [Streptomyces nigra]|uniref:hypothetical protein n=1 Tax=Streptomyces TaxID=1883 RepID=UPI001F3846AE|nr:hypothetical protein [Streptomyces sp. FB2]MCF2539627.1 hypothetical protein [Streptomyces sp. FB2]